MMVKHKWLKPIKKARKVEKIHANLSPWKQDTKGFFLIKPNYKNKTIHVGYCTNDNVLKYSLQECNIQVSLIFHQQI